MNKKFKKLILPLSILAALQVNALGLGTLQVDSALDENLIGKIPLVFDRKEKIDDITISLATDEDYKRVGLDKSYVPSNIEVKIASQGKSRYIELTSNSPVSEPIVSLLLVVDWANGHLLREYTLLLDPPLFNTTQTQDSYTDNITVQPYSTPDKIEEVIQYEEPVEYQEPQQVQQTQNIQYDNTISSSGSHDVSAGESLWGIASLYAGNGVSTQQMMVTIFNNNTSAFSDNDMNLLRKGAVLVIPNVDEIGNITQSQALAQVRSQINKWSNLQQEDTQSRQQTDVLSDYAIDLIPPKDQDSYNDSNSSSAKSSDNKVTEKLNQAQEELINSKLENNELQNKITELEQILKDQEAAISLKDNSLAQLQQQLMESDKNKQAATNEVDAIEDVLDDATENTVDTIDDIVDSVSGEGQELVDDISDTFAENTQETQEDVTDTDDTIDDSTTDTATQAVTTDIALSEPTFNKPRSFMDKVMNYKKEGLIGLGVLLLGGLLLMFKRKNAAQVVDVDSSGLIDDYSNEPAMTDLEETADDFVETVTDEIDPLKEDVEAFVGDVSDITVVDEHIDTDITIKPEDVELDKVEDIDSEEFSLDLDLDGDLEDEVESIVDLEYEKVDVEAEIENNLKSKKSDADSSDETQEADVDDLSLDFDGDSLDLDLDSDGLDLDNDDLDLDVDDLELSLGNDDLDLDDDLLSDDNMVEKISEEQQLEDDLDLSLDFNTEEISLDNVVDDSNELEDLVFETDETDINADANDLFAELDSDLDLTIDTETDTAELVDFESELDESIDDIGIPEISLDDSSETTDEEFNLDLNFDEIIDDDANDTKLDLARAYFEMGDIKGAKQMVEEIIVDGNDAQVAIAKELIDEIESS